MRPLKGGKGGRGIRWKKQFKRWYTKNSELGAWELLCFPGAFQIESNSLEGIGSQIFLMFAFSVADWERKASLVFTLPKSTYCGGQYSITNTMVLNTISWDAQ
jgi:hypothetical protein